MYNLNQNCPEKGISSSSIVFSRLVDTPGWRISDENTNESNSPLVGDFKLLAIPCSQ